MLFAPSWVLFETALCFSFSLRNSPEYSKWNMVISFIPASVPWKKWVSEWRKAIQTIWSGQISPYMAEITSITITNDRTTMERYSLCQVGGSQENNNGQRAYIHTWYLPIAKKKLCFYYFDLRIDSICSAENLTAKQNRLNALLLAMHT